MSEIKRYCFEQVTENDCAMIEDDYGQYITFDDHESQISQLEQELANVSEQLAEAKAALAAQAQQCSSLCHKDEPCSITADGKCDLAAQAQQEGKVIPHDFYTHKEAWRGALVIAEAYAKVHAPDVDDKAYWRHELRAFDRAFDALPPAPEGGE